MDYFEEDEEEDPVKELADMIKLEDGDVKVEVLVNDELNRVQKAIVNTDE